MKDLFGNSRPVEICTDEWWFNGRIIQKQDHPRLPQWISSEDKKICQYEIHKNKRDATKFCLENPCIDPENLPKNYIG